VWCVAVLVFLAYVYVLCDGSGLEGHDLLVEELFELFAADVVFVEIKLEEFRVERGCDRFVIGVMVCLEIRVSQRIFHRNPFLRIKRQCRGEEVHCQWIGIGEELCEWPALPEGQGADIVARPPSGDGVEFI